MIWLLIIIIIIFILFNIKNLTDDTIIHKYKEETFKIRKSDKSIMDNKAIKLYNLKSKLNKLSEYCYQNSLPTHDDSIRFYNRFKNIPINETSSNEESAAYVVNKDKELRICIDGENENDTMFVLLHECSHIMSKSYGHNEEFKKKYGFFS